MLGYCILLFLFILLILCTKIEIQNGDTCSRIYGIAYYNYLKNSGVCYPIPFNIIANLINTLLCKLRQPKFIINDISKTLSKGRELSRELDNNDRKQK